MATMDVMLTDIGKRWLQDHYPQGIVWEYDVDKPFKLRSITARVVDLTLLGISYQIPLGVDGQPTIARTNAARAVGERY